MYPAHKHASAQLAHIGMSEGRSQGRPALGESCVPVVAGASRVTTVPRPGWRAASGLLVSSVAALGPFRGELGRGR